MEGIRKDKKRHLFFFLEEENSKILNKERR